MSSVSNVLAEATRRHLAGQLAEAEQLYRQILQRDPENVQVLHQLGTLAIQVGQLQPALEMLTAAVRLDKSRGETFGNLAEIYRQQGDLDQATTHAMQALRLSPELSAPHTILGDIARLRGDRAAAAEHFRRVIKIEPENTHARLLLGRVQLEMGKLADAEACFRRVLRDSPRETLALKYLAELLQRQERLDEARQCYEQLLQVEPNQFETLVNYGTILKHQKSFAAAETQFRNALAIEPQNAVALSNLGSVLGDMSRYTEAVEVCRQACQFEPQLEAGFYNLGYSLQHLDRFDEAIDAFREALKLAPDSPGTHGRLASCLQSLGRKEEAIAAFRECLRLDPNQVSALSNLGVLIGELGYYQESLAPFTKATQLAPDFAPGFYNLACSLYQLDQYDETIAACQRAVTIDPSYAEAHMQLANAYKMIGRLKDAIPVYRRSIALRPTHAGAHSNLVYSMNFDPMFDANALFAEHLEWGRKHADPWTAQAAPHTNDRSESRRLKIGYLSSLFSKHAVNFFSEPVLASHDHAQFEVFCYSGVVRPDKVTERLRPHFDQWREIHALDDAEVAKLVRQDAIDILVDLAGHIAGGRLQVFARKPAPIQVTYIGYQNTTGMRGMDYRLTDEWSDPPGVTDRYYTEKLVRLPRTFFCYQPTLEAPLVERPPVVDNGHITFGSFNNFAKITPQVLSTWAQILVAVPNSRFLLLTPLTPWLRQYVIEAFAQHGIGPERIEFVQKCRRTEFLNWISRVDVALDPFPFNGHTTTCDTLWMGVPVVTLAGQSYVSRFGSSALVTLGYSDWIARTPQQYIEIAARLANDRDRLRALRQTLRAQMLSSPICDAPGFTRTIEAAYRDMWVEWCRQAR